MTRRNQRLHPDNARLGFGVPRVALSLYCGRRRSLKARTPWAAFSLLRTAERSAAKRAANPEGPFGSGKSVTWAPAEKARPPAPVRIATRCFEWSNSAKADCRSTATCLLIAFSFSGRLIAMIATGRPVQRQRRLLPYLISQYQRPTTARRR